MAKYTLPRKKTFISPTPAGAYYCVSSSDMRPARKFLLKLMLDEQGARLNLKNLQALTGLKEREEVLGFFYHLQQLGWVQGFNEPEKAPKGRLEDFLPELLPALSASGKALLADHQGFYLASAGFSHEVAEELSAMSANAVSLHKRYQAVLENNLGIESSAWGVVDAAGNSRIGIWPIYVGDQQFSLVIGGLPLLNRPQLIDIIWALTIRYGSVESDEDNKVSK